MLTGVGNFIGDFACHPINLSLLLTGVGPYRVSAVGGCCYGTGVVDHLELTMVYRGEGRGRDRTVSIDSSRFSPENCFETEMVVVTGEEVLEYGGWGEGREKPFSWVQRHESAYVSEMNYFHKVLCGDYSDTKERYGNVPPINPSTEDIRTTKIVTALVQSLYTKRQVFLDEDLNVLDPKKSIPITFLGKFIFFNFRRGQFRRLVQGCDK